MISLPDVNVLIALAWPNHIHHRAAHRWLRKHQAEGWATCPLTQASFVRVSSNAKIIPQARSPADAIEVLRRMTKLAHHVFWNDDIEFASSKWVAHNRLYGYRQVTDAHLLAVALSHRGRVVTFDRGYSDLVPVGIPHLAQGVMVLPTTADAGGAVGD